MKPIRLDEIATATGGRLLNADPAQTVTAVCTDTRAMRPNSLFIALKGENFDAHDHLEPAFNTGAAAALVHHEERTTNPCILVDDTRRAMGRLANHVRRQFDRTKVVAVAGSNGKTGTKHLIHSALSSRLKGSMSPKSFNNDVGVPITLFAVEPGDDFVVVEIGTNHPGEVSHLSRMCEPDIAIITSIGEEHMEFFKDLDGVRKENAAVVDGLRGAGAVFITGDDPKLPALLHTATTFGTNPNCTLTAHEVVSTLDGTRFRVGTETFVIPQIGRHNAANALAAIAVARAMGLSDEEIRSGLSGASSPEMRMSRRTIGPVTIINDAYNANPTSVRAALTTLSEVQWSGRKIAVLGEMRELGDHAAAAHRTIADLARSDTLNDVVFVGAAYEFTNDPTHHRWFSDSSTAAARIGEIVRPGDLVLIKASRSIRLERVAEAIEKRFS